MKTKSLVAILLATFTTAWLAVAQDDTNSTQPDPNNLPSDATAPDQSASPADQPAVTTDKPAAAPEQQAAALSTTPANTEPAPTNGLVLNFHDVPLNAVLNYLSAKAGLIVVSDVNLQGKVSIVAEQPITTNDIVQILNDQLGKNNYSAMLQGRTLTIMDAERAKTYAFTKVKVAGSYTNIPQDDEIVTEILPLHTLTAQQLIKDLDVLIPRGATVTANEAGNSIIMTAQQKDVRRIDEIINALDGTALSEVKVTVLRYADSKAVATELKEIFQAPDSDVTRAATRNSMVRGGRGGGGFGGPMGMMFGGGGGNGGGGGDSAQNNVSTHSVFTSDDQLNAVISSAPPDYMVMITNVIADLDQPSQDVTVMKVFHLRHADPGEIADELASMFPSTTANADQNNRTMGMRFMPPFMQQQSSGNSQTPRTKRELTVMVVPDRRTQSVIVSASKDMMDQIKGVVEDLDQGTQGVQKVTALDIGGADPATVQETLQGLFSSQNSRNPNTTQTATPLANRATGNANAQTTAAQNSATSGSTSTGTGTGIH
jgi:type II secretory pathway component GspD/PulD (secretin)